MVLGFTTLAAVLVGAVAIKNGAWTGLIVSLVMIGAAIAYYRWMIKNLRQNH